MNYLHYEVDLESGDVVEVTLDGQANVLLMQSTDFDRYQEGRRYEYYGGHAEVSPLRIRAPHAGHWHVVVDLGGYGGVVGAAVRVVQPSVAHA